MPEDKKAEKKKLIRVVGLESEKTYAANANNTEARFALMSSPANGRKQCHQFMSCKDYMHDIAAASIVPGMTCHYWNDKNNAPIDTSKLRLLVQRGFGNSPRKADVDAFKEKLFSAKRVLNHFEDMAGWGRSTITTVKHSLFNSVWLITGPAEWMSHPTLLSMATLIIRFICYHGPITFKSQKDIDAFFKEKSDSGGKDSNYMSECWGMFAVIISNYKKIFAKEIVEAYTATEKNVYYHSAGGIVSLCSFKSIDKEANTALKKLCAKKK